LSAHQLAQQRNPLVVTLTEVLGRIGTK
jgi:hypothetical protein